MEKRKEFEARFKAKMAALNTKMDLIGENIKMKSANLGLLPVTTKRDIWTKEEHFLTPITVKVEIDPESLEPTKTVEENIPEISAFEVAAPKAKLQERPVMRMKSKPMFLARQLGRKRVISTSPVYDLSSID